MVDPVNLLSTMCNICALNCQGSQSEIVYTILRMDPQPCQIIKTVTLSPCACSTCTHPGSRTDTSEGIKHKICASSNVSVVNGQHGWLIIQRSNREQLYQKLFFDFYVHKEWVDMFYNQPNQQNLLHMHNYVINVVLKSWHQKPVQVTQCH